MTTMPERGADATLVAAVDCGSNSTRLLIARVDGCGRQLHTITRRTVITRLGAGVDATSRLSDAAIGRVLDVLDGYRARWRTIGVDRVAITATSAVRDAGNADQFVAAVTRRAGTAPTVLTGGQEAALTFEGATAGTSDAHHVVCDIGGGSTELIVGANGVAGWTSLQLGSVRLRERHLHHDPPTVMEYASLLADVDRTLARQPDAFAARSAAPLIAVAGTALTAAAVARRATDPDVDSVDGTVLTLPELVAVVEDLAWVPAAARLRLPPIRPGREDVIVSGAMLLARLAHRFGFARIRVRIADLLDATARRAAVGAWPPFTVDGSL